MDKNTFMKELEQALSVLQEDEIKDILSEYEQHIDMKVKSGLSEEEAIADFGSLSELTADILSAYHVRADYGEDLKESSRAGESREKILENTKSFCSKAKGAVVHGARGLGGWLWGVILFWKRLFGRLFDGICKKLQAHKEKKAHMAMAELDGAPEEAQQAEAENGLAKAARPEMGKPYKVRRQKKVRQRKEHDFSWIGNGFSSIGRGIGFCIRGMFAAAVWGIRILWNAGWICVGVVLGLIGLCFLFAFGVIVVLMIGGYPLTGVMIGCLGLLLCLFSAAWLCGTFLWRRKSAGGDRRVSGKKVRRDLPRLNEEADMERKRAEKRKTPERNMDRAGVDEEPALERNGGSFTEDTGTEPDEENLAGTEEMNGLEENSQDRKNQDVRDREDGEQYE